MSAGVLDEWARALADELGLDIEVDVRMLLDVARVAAHEVDRPAAPLTTFLVGYAAAQRGGGPEATAAAAVVAERLAQSWGAERGEAPSGAPPA